MRLDVFLVQNKYYPSREKASDAIKKGIVMVNQKVITKPSYECLEDTKITITDTLLRYVSWGGLKLERAIDVFALDFQDKIVLDIGASTGGFTDCSLQHGAKMVYAVDVGSNQLAPTLKNDLRVHSYEQTNICDFHMDVHFDYLVMDVSFVSITKIIPYLIPYLDDTNSLICLFKPQFEIGKTNVKNGIVKDPKIHYEVVKRLIDFIEAMGLHVQDLTYSTQKGKMGNIEYLALVGKKNIQKKYDVKAIVQASHEM